MQTPNATALSRTSGTIRTLHPTPRRRSKLEREQLVRATESRLVRGIDGVQQVAKALGIPPSTAHRYILEIRTRWSQRPSEDELEARRGTLIRRTEEVQRKCFAALEAGRSTGEIAALLGVTLRAIRQEGWLLGLDRRPLVPRAAPDTSTEETLDSIPAWAVQLTGRVLAIAESGNMTEEDALEACRQQLLQITEQADAGEARSRGAGTGTEGGGMGQDVAR